MKYCHFAWALSFCAVIASVTTGQAPLLHYTFSEGGSPPTTENIGTFFPGPSPVIGLGCYDTSPNGTFCLAGTGVSGNEVTTPYSVALGSSSWTVGFCLRTSVTFTPVLSYPFSDDVPGGWRVFTDGAAGNGNIRMTGGTVPTIDIIGGAGSMGFVHVAWVHDTVANVVRAYLDGVLYSTNAAPAINLNSGALLRIGRSGTTSMSSLQSLDDFRLYDYAMSGAEVAAWAAHDLTGPLDFSKVMITEVSWGDPDGLEITNFDTAPVNLASWTVRWRDSLGTIISQPIGASIAPGESIVVVETTSIEPVPTGTQVLDRFPVNVPTTSSAITVALFDGAENPVDEVRVTDTSGGHPGWSFGSLFRGWATRGTISTTSGQVGVERIWGLDSNGGSDWTEQPNRSFGRENRSSGPRGFDPIAITALRINEIDDSPDFIEFHNPVFTPFGLGGWFVLCSDAQGQGHSVHMFPGSPILPFGFVVLGDSPTAPAELPASGVSYTDVGPIPWTSQELDCALYDSYGRLVDLVRATRADRQLVHNSPRAPSHWADFAGAAVRNLNGGDSALGRDPSGTDTNTGADFFPIYTRTMGSANLASSQAGPAGHGHLLDVRLNETGLGNGFQAIINAGNASAGSVYNFLVSLPHSFGQGPILGLGGDALANLPAFYNVPPFSGTLDAQGSARIEFDSGTLPAGVDADFLFVLQLPSGVVVARTLVLAFDT